MSVTFSGTKVDTSVEWGCRSVRLPNETEDDIGFNMANMNAIAFMRLLEIPNPEECYGSLPIGEMAKLVQKARASFDYRVDALCRPSFDKQGTTGPRIISQGIDASYFTRRLEEFANLVADYIEAGADTITWG